MKAGVNYTNTPFIQSMITCLSKVVDDGYKEDFQATGGGLLSTGSNRIYTPGQVKVINFFRFEGFSNPDNNAVLYIIETEDGLKGTLIDACGAHADPLVYRFMHDVESAHKKVRH